MKAVTFRYPKNTVTDMLLSLLCICIITLILQSSTQAKNEMACCSNIYDRIGFFNSYGFEVDELSEAKEIVVLPSIFDSVLEDYNEIQKTQGFDLSVFAGKSVEKYTYTLLNNPFMDKNATVYATLYVYSEKIIAADIYDPSVDGFIQGVITE